MIFWQLFNENKAKTCPQSEQGFVLQSYVRYYLEGYLEFVSKLSFVNKLHTYNSYGIPLK